MRDLLYGPVFSHHTYISLWVEFPFDHIHIKRPLIYERSTWKEDAYILPKALAYKCRLSFGDGQSIISVSTCDHLEPIHMTPFGIFFLRLSWNFPYDVRSNWTATVYFTKCTFEALMRAKHFFIHECMRYLHSTTKVITLQVTWLLEGSLIPLCSPLIVITISFWWLYQYMH